MIETLDDIVEHLCDKLGIYGAHSESCTGKNPCRVCYSSILRGRILAAVEVDRKLADAPDECEFQVGQVVKWKGQIGDCFATIRSIHKPENASGYVLWTELECGGSFPVLAKNVSSAFKKEGKA